MTVSEQRASNERVGCGERRRYLLGQPYWSPYCCRSPITVPTICEKEGLSSSFCNHKDYRYGTIVTGLSLRDYRYGTIVTGLLTDRYTRQAHTLDTSQKLVSQVKSLFAVISVYNINHRQKGWKYRYLQKPMTAASMPQTHWADIAGVWRDAPAFVIRMLSLLHYSS